MTDKAPFDIDGLVVSGLYDDEVFEDEFLPKHTVAVKFNQMSAVTQLIDISWDVSKKWNSPSHWYCFSCCFGWCNRIKCNT